MQIVVMGLDNNCLCGDRAAYGDAKGVENHDVGIIAHLPPAPWRASQGPRLAGSGPTGDKLGWTTVSWRPQTWQVDFDEPCTLQSDPGRSLSP